MNINPEGSITTPKGFLASGTHAGIRNKKEQNDICLISSESPTTTAATFTQNTFMAAPVIVSKRNIEQGNPRGIVVNSKIANACTGEQGLKDAEKMAEVSGEILGIDPSEIIVSSTGLIGAYLPMNTIEAGIKELGSKLSPDGGLSAANAIMTTDTWEKHISVSRKIDGQQVTVGGIAKGSGMIHPNMATMLAFVTTDCSITKELLTKALQESVDNSYNMITVDGDTSTNDMACCLANEKAGNPTISTQDDNYYKFKEMLDEVNNALSKQIVLDGEGANKLIEVTVTDARTFQDAKQVAMTVLNSNLVKTAFFGEDANWGRIVAAMGYSGVDVSPEDTTIWLDELVLFTKGEGVPFNEEKASNILKQDTINVTISLGAGNSSANGYGSDLSYEYVKINGSYRS